MTRVDASPAGAGRNRCPCTTAGAELRLLCDRLFETLTELTALTDMFLALPPEPDDNPPPASPTDDERLAAAWIWWIDQHAIDQQPEPPR